MFDSILLFVLRFAVLFMFFAPLFWFEELCVGMAKVKCWLFYSPKYKMLHHYKDSGYDLEMTYYEWQPNPHYVGNFLQSEGDVVQKTHIYLNAHEVDPRRKQI